jgi:hypothetical protein
MLLSLESIDEGLERFIFVLVHLEEPVPSLLEVVASHCKVSWMTLDFGVYVLDCGAHHTPEVRGSGAALAFEEREDIRQSRTMGMSQICSVVSRSIFLFSPLIMQVICDVMKSCRSCADFGPPFSFLGCRSVDDILRTMHEEAASNLFQNCVYFVTL